MTARSAPLSAPPPSRRLLGPALVSLAGVAILVALGLWQLDRMAWKRDLIATLTERLAAEPVALPPVAAWPGLSRADDEFRRVRVTGELLHDREALVYAIGSGLRTATRGLGYLVFTPLALDGGRLVMVNRGYVPDADKAPEARPAGQLTGPVEIVGVMRWPETRPMFAPGDDPTRNIWFVRDPVAIAASKGIEVAPFYLEQESPAAPGGLPQVGRLQPNLPNNHLQYALTWFSLALALTVIFFVWAFGRRRKVEG